MGVQGEGEGKVELTDPEAPVIQARKTSWNPGRLLTNLFT